MVVAAPHFNGGRLPQTPQEIIDSPIIYNTESWLPWCEAAGVKMGDARKGLCSNDSNLVLEAVRLGQGIALERRSLVHDAIERGELVQLCDVSAPYAYPYWLVWPPGKFARQTTRILPLVVRRSGTLLRATETKRLTEVLPEWICLSAT